MGLYGFVVWVSRGSYYGLVGAGRGVYRRGCGGRTWRGRGRRKWSRPKRTPAGTTAHAVSTRPTAYRRPGVVAASG
eukprot:3110637-Rhodomonas_salina.1